jgi:hypothetical protein
MPDDTNPYMDNWLLSINGVDCNIYTGPTGEDGHLVERTSSDQGRSALVRFKCNWQDRNDLLAGLVGTVDYVGGSIKRTNPDFYPTADRDIEAGQFPEQMFCTSVTRIEGRGWKADLDGSITGQPGWGYFAYAILDAEYTNPPYVIVPPAGNDGPFAFNDLVGEMYAISKTRVSGEVYSPPTGAYVWGEGSRQGKPVQDTNVGIIVPRYELSVTRMRMPIVPTLLFDELIGTVNEATLSIGANTVSPEAALFMGGNAEPRTDPYNGGIVYDVEMLWLVNGFLDSRNADKSWNWFLDPVGSWSKIVTNDEDQNPPFASADHDQLFANQIA